MKVVHVVSGGFVVDGTQFKTGDVVNENHRLFSKLIGRIKPDTELKKGTRLLILDDQSENYQELKAVLPTAKGSKQAKNSNPGAIRQVMGRVYQDQPKKQGIEQRIRQKNGRAVLVTEGGEVDLATSSLKVKDLDSRIQEELDAEMKAIMDQDFAGEPKLLSDVIPAESEVEVAAPVEVAPEPAVEAVEAKIDEPAELVVASDEAAKPKRNKKS